MYSVLNITDDITHCGNIGHVVNDFTTICNLAHQYDFKGINIDFRYLNSLSLPEGKELLERLNLKPVAFDFPVKLFADQQEFEQSLSEFESVAKKAHEIGCQLTLCYLPPFSNDLNFNDRFIQTSNRLKQLKYILKRYEIKIGFEFIGPTETRRNTKYDFIHTIDGTRALIASAELYGYGGFKLDVHHWQNSGASLLDLHHLDLEYILYLELNDGLAGYDIFTIPEFKRELPYQTGVTNVKDFLTLLYEKGYQGPVVVEPWNQTIKNMSLDKAIQTVKNSLDYCLAFN
ncbi:MAG: TIM barrel protein [Crocosphaera sp.]|nr:TIM barrel protein [Crocosphaera sp.]